jgi:hypothetical protein
MRLARFIFALLAPLLLATLAQAQTIRWETDPAQPNTLMLVFEGCSPRGEVTPPAIVGATLNYIGQSDNMSIVNGVVSRSTTQSFFLRARQAGPVQIPSFSVQTDKGAITVRPFSTSPQTVQDSIASSKLVPERTTVWTGEVFDLTYQLLVSHRSNPQINPTFEWNPAPLVAEEWGKHEVSESLVNGERRSTVTFRTRALAKTPNTVKLEAASHAMSVQTGIVGMGLLSQPRMAPVNVVSDQPMIEIRPLPPSPAGFTGAVGQFKLVSKVVPEKATVGEPVTWTLELSGTGNWPDIAGLPARDVSNDFEVVQPKAKRTPAEGKLFDVTLAEDVVLVPTKAGTYSLGPLTFTYFDPRSGSYKSINAPRTTVTIAAPSAPLFNPIGQSAPTNANESDIDKPSDAGPAVKRPLATPAAPAGIPRDPLPGSAEVGAPLARSTLIAWAAAPWAALLVFWGWLAIRRARQTDPVRPRREARIRLGKTLSHLQTAPEAERAALLLGWQHDTSILWQIPHAAPPATALPDAAWSALWREADRALYGARPELPADWIARAQEALAAKPVPGFKPHGLFLPRNLFPFAAALALAGWSATTLLDAAEATRPAAEPLAAYRSGNFAAAETAWRAAIKATPTDWIARHNLSLALAQQERPGEAAGQASAAFVQQPGDLAVRWHFALAAEKAGFAPGALAPFLQPSALETVARLASPAAWQRLLIFASVGGAVAIGLLLANAYGRQRRGIFWTGIALLVATCGLAGNAVAGVLTYGIAGDARAVLVARSGTLRSIPTEVDTAQKTTAMAAGAMGLATKTFLGWTQIEFENGQTGWVRQEEIVPLWK